LIFVLALRRNLDNTSKNFSGSSKLFSWILRIFQRFRLVKFIEKLKTRVKDLKIEKIIAFDKYLHELFFAIYFYLSKDLFLSLKKN